MNMDALPQQFSDGHVGNLVSKVPSGGASGPIEMHNIATLADRAAGMVSAVRSRLLVPDARKVAPAFSAERVASLCGIPRSDIAKQRDLPQGTVVRPGSQRVFSLTEVQIWTRAMRRELMRPAGCHGITIAIGNFKGGVGKTTTSMVLAQGLSMRGHRVLVIDTDPQASLTTLFGVLPETEVAFEAPAGQTGMRPRSLRLLLRA